MLKCLLTNKQNVMFARPYLTYNYTKTSAYYAANGNIASKTGIGKYTYDTGKKNAVVQVENTNNLIQGTASLTYNAFNKVATVVQGTNTLTITYGPDHQRTKTVLVNGSNTTTTLYADNYEQRTANGVTTSYHYVASPDGLAAVYVKKNGTTTAYYVETDHLGSIINLFDASGTKQFSATYDAWGKQTITKNAMDLTRGYTGHEHWNVFGLIDMNGRFYDPLLGRFLSPDPYVQAPENPQSYNRYAYCFNNPLKYTDPSGYRCSTIGLQGSGADDLDPCGNGSGGDNTSIMLSEVIVKPYDQDSYDRAAQKIANEAYSIWLRYIITPSINNHYYGPNIYNYNNNYYYSKGRGGGGRAIRQPIRKNVVVQNGGGSIASTATTTAGCVSNIIGTAAGTSVFNARNLSVAQQAKYGVNALKSIGNGAGIIGIGLTLTTAWIEFAYGQANTHTIVDIGVCAAGLVGIGIAAFIGAPVLAIGTVVFGTVYGISSAAGLGTTIDKVSNNWGQKLLYGDEKDN